MSITIKDRFGKTVYHTVAKTSRGFSKRQRLEIQTARRKVQEA